MCSESQLNGYNNGLERLGHDLRAVVDREDNICDASIGKGLDLVLDHGLVRELDERLGVGEGLRMASVLQLLLAPRGSQRGRHTRGLRRVPNPPTRMMAALAVSGVSLERN